MNIHLGSSLIDEKHPEAIKGVCSVLHILVILYHLLFQWVPSRSRWALWRSKSRSRPWSRSKSRSKSSSTTYSFSKSHWEVDGHFEVHTIPVHLQQDTQLLSTAQRKHWDQNLKIKVKVKVKVTERSCRFNLSHVVTYCVYYIEPDILVSIVLGNDLVPDGTKPLPNQCKLIINKIFLNMSMHY